MGGPPDRVPASVVDRVRALDAPGQTRCQKKMVAGTAPSALLKVGPGLAGPAVPAKFYSRSLLFIAGMGGLLYGIDVGIIAAALLYLSASALQLHLHCTVIVDDDAASALTQREYYDWGFQNELEWTGYRAGFRQQSSVPAC